MTDVETMLRQRFAADAEGAPPVDLVALAGEVRGTVRRRRRRTATLVAAVAALVTAGVAVVVPRLLPVTTAPAVQVQPTAPPPVLGPALRWRGVVVPVPASYLDESALTCGVPVKDAAYVLGPGIATLDCAPLVPHPERLTTVLLMPPDWTLPVGGSATDGDRVLADGRTMLTRLFPSVSARVVVTSPDPALARRLLDGARVETAPPACPPRAVAAPTDQLPGASLVPGFQAVGGDVCGYTGGWLASWRHLDQPAAAALLTDLRTPPVTAPRTPPQCAVERFDPVGSSHWTVRLRGADGSAVQLWVSAGPCVQAGVYGPNGAFVPMTRQLADRLAVLAPGITVLAQELGEARS